MAREQTVASCIEHLHSNICMSAVRVPLPNILHRECDSRKLCSHHRGYQGKRGKIIICDKLDKVRLIVQLIVVVHPYNICLEVDLAEINNRYMHSVILLYIYHKNAHSMVVNTRQTPSSPALMTTSPFSPRAAPKIGPWWPLCSRMRVPVRASQVRSFLSAELETRM